MIRQYESIELYRAGGMWMAKHSDPKVFELFDTDTLPTPYSASRPESEVVREIQARNQDCRVFARGPIERAARAGGSHALAGFDGGDGLLSDPRSPGTYGDVG